MALITGVTAAFAYMSVRSLGKTEHTTTVVCYFTGVSFILSIPLILLDWKPLQVQSTLFLIASGIFATSAQFAMTKAYKLEKASLVSLYGYLYPMFSYFFSLILMKEVPDVASMIGTLMILLTAGWIYKASVRPDTLVVSEPNLK
jgi:drug/metabolite transporter (DMT)-like permease